MGRASVACWARVVPGLHVRQVKGRHRRSPLEALLVRKQRSAFHEAASGTRGGFVFIKTEGALSCWRFRGALEERIFWR